MIRTRSTLEESDGFMKITLRTLVAFSLLSFILILFSPVSSPSADQSDRLFLGNSNIPPVLFLENGEPKGVVLDIFREVSKRVTSDLDVRLMNWADAQKMVQSGEAAGLLQLNRNPDRETYLNFSNPLLISEFPIFRKSDRTDILGPDDLKGKTVGVEAAGYPRTLLNQLEDVNVFLLRNWSEGFKLVRNGTIDAVLVDRWVGEWILAAEQIHGITTAPKPVDTLVSHIGIRQDLPELLDKVNAALVSMKADGTFSRILARWKDEEVVYISRQQQEYWDWLQMAALGVSALVILVGFLSFKLILANHSLRQERSLLEKRVEERTQELAASSKNERHLRELAEQANSAKSQFLATVSHELRTPLTGVLGVADMLNSTDLTERQMELVETIKSSGSLLISIINDILDQSKMEAKKLDIEAVEFDLPDCINALEASFQQQVLAKGLIFTVKIDPTVPTRVVGDPTRVRQVLSNLISNAIKFTESGRVRLSVSCLEGRDIRFDVLDTGIGIPADNLSSIFSPFEQVEKSTARRYGGTGLGLSIAKRLVELMKGEIAVEQPEDGGTLFWIRLPLPQAQKPKVPSYQAAPPKYQSVQNPTMHVLIAEDNDINQMVIGAMLGALGYSFEIAQDGIEAVEAIETGQHFDLILMDIRMPRMNGVEALATIREKNPDLPLPVIALTADVFDPHVEEFNHAGFDAVVAKPIDMKRLYDVMQKVVFNAGSESTKDKRETV